MGKCCPTNVHRGRTLPPWASLWHPSSHLSVLHQMRRIQHAFCARGGTRRLGTRFCYATLPTVSQGVIWSATGPRSPKCPRAIGIALIACLIVTWLHDLTLHALLRQLHNWRSSIIAQHFLKHSAHAAELVGERLDCNGYGPVCIWYALQPSPWAPCSHCGWPSTRPWVIIIRTRFAPYISFLTLQLKTCHVNMMIIAIWGTVLTWWSFVLIICLLYVMHNGVANELNIFLFSLQIVMVNCAIYFDIQINPDTLAQNLVSSHRKLLQCDLYCSCRHAS